jgi:hypothetical protein
MEKLFTFLGHSEISVAEGNVKPGLYLPESDISLLRLRS